MQRVRGRGHVERVDHDRVRGEFVRRPGLPGEHQGAAARGCIACEHRPDVPAEVLWPRDTWTDKDAYDAEARKLGGMFVDNFKAFADRVSPAVRAAGPKPDSTRR